MNATAVRWAARVPRDSAAAAASLRELPRIEAALGDDGLWLRGRDTNDALDSALRRLPGALRFTLLDDDQLVPLGRRVPLGSLPRGDWRPLAQWLVLELPPPALAGVFDARVPLRLVRSAREAAPTGLVTELSAWVAYATTAPEVRLRRLSFAAAGDGRVLVSGAPLPSVNGRPYVADDGVAVPCGYAFDPLVEAALVRRALGLADGEWALMQEDGGFERIAADEFVPATRSAARATARGST